MAGGHSILAESHWAAIRSHWELDSDSPSCATAAKRASYDLGFNPPTKQAVAARMKLDAEFKNDAWTRRGRLAEINVDAQRRADSLVNADGRAAEKKTEEPGEVRSDQDEAATKRAAVLVRHRQEWMLVVSLRQQALHALKGSRTESLDLLKVARGVADVTQIQQTGERKAWGLDIMDDPTGSQESRTKLYLPDNKR